MMDIITYVTLNNNQLLDFTIDKTLRIDQGGQAIFVNNFNQIQDNRYQILIRQLAIAW